jgi:hypothetical protein
MSLKLISSFDRQRLVTYLIFNRTISTSHHLLLSNNKKNNENELPSSSSDSSDDEKSRKKTTLDNKNPNLKKYKMSFTTLKTPRSLNLAKPLGKSKSTDKTSQNTLQQHAEKVAKLIDSKKVDQIAEDLIKPLKQKLEKSENAKENDENKSLENLISSVKDMMENNKKDFKAETQKPKQTEETKAPNAFDSFIL